MLFAVGDKVVYRLGRRGMVTKCIKTMNGKDRYEVTFNDGLIPKNIVCFESDLKFSSSQYKFNFNAPNTKLGDRPDVINFKKDTNTYCPKCGSKWKKTESPIFGKLEVWYDCVKCNKRKEDLV